ncbi:TetR/AcrR family transcriptional regulator [Deinococcus radiotolerans]|uniref:TetR family transcriptional regulator n=1 Tax=Deinococcus radiotolerans TaxID=1309407 RepID=A0ABQ2FMW0_9DEIO|nr:TetR/AcrR family transcriptional regulator [Deinococcus radiotolerans]GGL08860.1 TetR family transcriptional regulator [Deinococcus radiotolerans]
MALTSDDWLRAAYHHFADHGPDGVRVERLARTLGVSKGSFYWHHRDRQALLTALLSRWEQLSTDLIHTAEQQPCPRASVQWVLDSLLQSVPNSVRSETQFLNWSRSDPQAALVAARVEDRRVAFLTRQVRRSGLDPADAPLRAELLYAALIGLLDRVGRGSAAASLPTLSTHLLSLIPPRALTPEPA